MGKKSGLVKPGSVETLETLIVERQKGKNLVSMMSQALARDAYQVVIELLSNSYDADAKNVRIHYDPEKNMLAIEDDGEGMDKEKGIRNFFRLGDSEKITNPITKSGRKRIGHFGIATVLLEFLANNFTLESWYGSEKIAAAEDFSDRSRDPDKINVKIYKCNPEEHGTKIVMNNLKFLEDGRDFDVKTLREKIQWEMPIRPDYSVYVNNEKITPKRIDTARKYIGEAMLKKAGEVKVTAYLTSERVKDKGFYFYVNGRLVGDSDMLKSDSERGLRDRLICIVEADGLDNCIGFDRTRFQTDHPAFKEVTDFVLKTTKSIRADYDTEEKVKNRTKLRTITDEARMRLEKRINIKAKDLMLEPEKGDYKLKLEKLKDEFSILDETKRAIIIDPSVMNLAVKNYAFLDVIMVAFEEYAASAIAKYSIGINGKKTISDFEKSKMNALDILRGKGDSLSKILAMEHKESMHAGIKLNKNRVYNLAEIQLYLEIDNTFAKRLEQAAILTSKHSGYMAADIETCAEKIKNFVPVYKVVQDFYKGKSQVSS
ncbi:MAG: ATP-binding protein, partial [Nanoarchaeota archaeon]|nr:ATP-binding protein [Nanoarchaeota archaeon]